MYASKTPISAKTLSSAALFCALAFARQSERTIPWDQVSQTIANQHLELSLPDGTLLRGLGMGTEGDELVLRVAGSTNNRSHPRGRARIPRNQVSSITIHTREPGGHRGSAIGVGVGAAAGAPAAVYLGSKANASGGAAAAVLLGAAVGGWLIGHHFDEPSTEIIHVIPLVTP